MRTAPGLIHVLALLAACTAPLDEEAAAARDEAYRQGNALLDRERYREARSAFERALEADPGYAPAWTELANLHARLGRLPEAIEAYERALAADPGYARACHNLGVVHAEQYRYLEALEVLEKCLRLRPGYAPALQTKGLIHLRLGENGLAEEARRSALGLDSSLVKARRRLGRICTLQRRYEEAEPLLLEAARLAPDEAASWLRLGQLYLDWNRPQQALGPSRRLSGSTRARRTGTTTSRAPCSPSAAVRRGRRRWPGSPGSASTPGAPSSCGGACAGPGPGPRSKPASSSPSTTAGWGISRAPEPSCTPSSPWLPTTWRP